MGEKIDEKKMIKPARLMQGDTIGIVAPASPFDRKRFDEGIAAIHRLGFGTKFAKGIFERQGYLAGTDQQRAGQLNAMADDDAVQALMCARGGFGSLKILAHLDYDLIRARAKPLIGFSDITTLHQALHLYAGLVTFHGPTVTTLARGDEATRLAWRSALTDPDPMRFDLSGGRTLQAGVCQGHFVGGNLTTLCHMVGTPYAMVFKDALLLIEDTGEAPYRIDRILTQMMMAGAFDGLRGLVLGSFKDCGDTAEVEAIVQRLFGRMGIPIVDGVQMGHGRRNLTVPLGLPARLDTDKGELTFLETAFKG